MAKIILSAFSDEYNRDIDVQLKALGELGIGYIEPRFVGEKNISELTDEEAHELKEKLDKAGIKVYSIGSPLGKINLADDFDKHLALCERVCKIAKILGAQCVRVFSFYLREGDKRDEKTLAEVKEKLSKMLDIADKYGVTLCHENEANIYGEGDKDCRTLLDAMGGRLKCVFDMGNFVLGGYKPYPDGYNLLKDYIKYFHIKDAIGTNAIVPPGCGDATIADILSAYAKEHDGDVIATLEPHLETFSGLNKLTDVTFDNPYKFESPEAAFVEAANRIKAIVDKI